MSESFMQYYFGILRRPRQTAAASIMYTVVSNNYTIN